MSNSMEARIDSLESDIEIQELRSKYCWYAARGDIAPMMALFTEDLVFEGPPGADGQRAVIHGREELLPYFTAGIGKPGLVVPLIMNHVISIDGDEATGTCAMESPVTPLPGGSAGGPPMIYYYYDRFRRLDGRWCFSYRRLSLYRPVFDVDPNETRGVDGRWAA
jgi:hypothetical protein